MSATAPNTGAWYGPWRARASNLGINNRLFAGLLQWLRAVEFVSVQLEQVRIAEFGTCGLRVRVASSHGTTNGGSGPLPPAAKRRGQHARTRGSDSRARRGTLSEQAVELHV